MIDADHRALISRADLIYKSPAASSMEGQAIGNGRMGTMVWTSPRTVHWQINRSDVFAVNKNHRGSAASTAGAASPTNLADYCGGCAGVELDLGSDSLSPGEAFEQRLSLYDAEVSLKGHGILVRCFVSSASDVLVVELDDRRPEPQPVRLRVSLLRPPVVRTDEHVARSGFSDGSDRTIIEQLFSEGGYHCGSAVGVHVVGGMLPGQESAERVRTIVAPARRGRSLILISSAASWSAHDDVKAIAGRILDEGSGRAYEALREEHVRWWHDLWERTTVRISSADGLGDFMERVRALHLYYMAASSRGLLPPKWNGSIFTTEGDLRTWGSQYWVWTTEMHYFPLFASDATELTEPYLGMYLEQLPDARKAAEQRWGVQGAFYPETAPFDGPVVLPDDVAREVQDVYRGRESKRDLSEHTRGFCRYEWGLRSVTEEYPGGSRFSYISHLVSSGCELAVQAWWRYRYTGDKEWLRRAYPLLRDVVEFYRHFVQRGADGRCHIAGTNVHEDFWGSKDGIMDLAAIRGTAPLAIRAAEILGLDHDLRINWQELLDDLTPYPMGNEAEARALTGAVLADDTWAAGRLGEVDGSHNLEDVWLNPIFPFEDWTLETRVPSADHIAQRATDLAPRMKAILEGASCNTVIRTPIVRARAGRGENLPAVLASYYRAFQPMANGWGLFEGPAQAHSIEVLGCIATTLQEGMLQGVSPRPGQPEVITVFAAWPREWECSFRLLARGGFLVTSAVRNGEVQFVRLLSRLGESCRLRNPWGRPCVVRRTQGDTQELAGEILRFDTMQEEDYLVLPKESPGPGPRRIAPGPATGPSSYSFTLSNGTVVGGTLGRGTSQETEGPGS